MAVKRVSVGVVGLGAVAQAQHLPNLLSLDDLFRIEAVGDLSPRLTAFIADRLPGPVFTSTDWQDICGHPQVEAVLLLTPGAHQKMSEQSLRWGRHVFAEKPLSLTAEDALRLAAVAETTRRVLQVGYMKVHEQVFSRFTAGLDEIGQHRLIRHTVCHPTHRSQLSHLEIVRFDDADQTILKAAEAHEEACVNRAIGNLPADWNRIYRKFLVGSMIHTVSVLRTAWGELPRITLAEMWPPSTSRPRDQPPSLHIRGVLSDGGRVELNWLWLPSSPSYRETLEAHGDKGSLEVSFPQPYLRHSGADLTISNQEGLTHCRGGSETAFVRELRAFHTAIITGDHPRDARDTAVDLAWLRQTLDSMASRAGLGRG